MMTQRTQRLQERARTLRKGATRGVRLALEHWRSHLDRKWIRIPAHLAIVMTYASTYLVLRYASNDQWYLPAGLRFAALLFVPTRFWSTLFVGEATALAIFRVPMLPDAGLAWYLVSVWLTWPPVAFIAARLRRWTSLPAIRDVKDAAALLIGVLLATELTTLASKVGSYFLMQGHPTFKPSDLVTYSMGDVQGAMLVTFAMLVYASRHGCTSERALRFRLESIAATIPALAIAAAILAADIAEPSVLEAARLALLVPAIILAIRHAWRGAATGAVVANLALFITIPHQEAGERDTAALVVQQVFAFVTGSLFVIGARLHERTVESARSTAAETEARRLARAGYEDQESRMRQRALLAEQVQEDSKESLRNAMAWLRSNGHSEVAMTLMGVASRQSREYARVVGDFYPLSIERSGLYAALMSDGFLGPIDAAGTQCDMALTGNPGTLPTETQITAFRIISEACDYFLGVRPARLQLRVHTAPSNGGSRVRIALYAYQPAVLARSPVDTAKLAQLRRRVSAYEGSLHTRANKLRVILPEAVEDRPSRRFDPATETNGLRRSGHAPAV